MKTKIIGIVVLFAIAVPASADAHVDISPLEAPAGKSTGFSFTVGHGCEGAATTGLTVEVPEAVGKFKLEQLQGWKSSSPPGRMVWKGGPLTDGELLDFPFRASVFGSKGDQVPFKVIQSCEGGREIAWISVEEEGPGHGTPAPTLTLTSTAAQPKPAPEPSQEDSGPASEEQTPAAATGEQQAAAEAASTDEDDGGGIGGFAVLALIAAVVTTLVVIVRARRSGT